MVGDGFDLIGYSGVRGLEMAVGVCEWGEKVCRVVVGECLVDQVDTALGRRGQAVQGADLSGELAQATGIVAGPGGHGPVAGPPGALGAPALLAGLLTRGRRLQ